MAMAVNSKEAFDNCVEQFEAMMDQDLVKKYDESDWDIKDKRISNLQRLCSGLLNYIRLKRFEDGDE